MQPFDRARLLANADRCVMCGLCSSRCPTYLKTHDEAESPRGRVALISAAFNAELPISARWRAHVDSCLSCRACEAVCPSGVPVTALVDQARAAAADNRRRTWRQRVAERARGNPRGLRLSGAALRLVDRSGLRAIARRSGVLKALHLQTTDERLPRIPSQPSLRPFHAATGTERGRVALFRGCATGVFDTATLRDAIDIMNRAGISVHVPVDQACCGALQLHDGMPAAAEAMARTNIRAFDTAAVDAIVGTATGCTATLADYALHWSGLPGATPFGAKIIDINRYLADLEWPADMMLAPLQKRVAVHVPCSQAYGLRDAGAPFSLLSRIPGIELIALPGNDLCCGAAGRQMLTHGAMADALLSDKLAALTRLAPDVLVTSNVGCALHFRHGLKQAGMNIEVMHPVALLRRQLSPAGQLAAAADLR